MAEPKTIMNGGPDRSVTDSPERIFEALFRVHDMRFEVCLPAIVRDYNRNSHLALVQPLVNMVSSEGKQLERAPILVPVRRVMYGEFMVDFPLNIGDTGWVIAGDRDSENALLANSGNVTSSSNPNEGGHRPATRLLHKYRFGFFIPDRWGTINLATKTGDPNYMDGQNIDGQNVDYADKAIIRSQNGKTRIIMSKNGNMEINLDGQLSIISAMNIVGNMSIQGNININGSVETTGGISSAGAIHSSSDISSEGKVISDSDVVVNIGDKQGISLKQHKHSFPHIHQTPSGETTDQNPERTDQPYPGASEEREVTVNLTIKNTSSDRELVALRWDRLARTASGSSSTAIASISASSSTAVSFKIKNKTGDTFTKDPYFRLLFFIKQPGSNRWYYGTKNSLVANSSISCPFPSSRTDGSSSVNSSYSFLYTFDFTPFLNGDIYGMSDIDMSLNINTSSIGGSTLTQPTYTNSITYSNDKFVSEWSISQ